MSGEHTPTDTGFPGGGRREEFCFLLDKEFDSFGGTDSGKGGCDGTYNGLGGRRAARFAG